MMKASHLSKSHIAANSLPLPSPFLQAQQMTTFDQMLTTNNDTIHNQHVGEFVVWCALDLNAVTRICCNMAV